MTIFIPSHPLAIGSLQIESGSALSKFSDWSVSEHKKSYQLMQKVIELWKRNGISDYLIYGKETTLSGAIFKWEIVPYPKEGSRLWNQCKVLWNITFGGSSALKGLTLPSKPLIQRIDSAKNDAF